MNSAPKKQSDAKGWMLVIAGLVLLGGFIVMATHKVTTFDISQYVDVDIAKSLSKHDVLINTAPLAFMDPRALAVYRNVDPSLVDHILNSDPKEVWKTCQPFTSKAVCRGKWLTMNEMWALGAKADPRSSAPVQSDTYKLMRQLETDANTRCSLIAASISNELTSSETTERVNGDERVLYLCANKQLRLVQVEHWSM